MLAVEVLVTVVVLTLGFAVELDKVTIWGCLGGTVTVVVVTTDTDEEPKLLVAVVGTSLMYWTYIQLKCWYINIVFRLKFKI